MRVYHFLPARWAIEDIVKQRVKISEIDQTNDPFELWCVSQPNRELRNALRGFKEAMGKRFGLLCFTEDWVNPLLWSHYADKHRGICLGFDVESGVLRQVNYVKERSELKVPVTKETAQQLLWTKYWDWKYEEEWRGWLQLDQRENGQYFYYFDARQNLVQLREVIVGALCETKEKEVSEALGGDSEVKVIKARLAFQTFRVVIKQDGF